MEIGNIKNSLGPLREPRHDPVKCITCPNRINNGTRKGRKNAPDRIRQCLDCVGNNRRYATPFL